MRAQGRHATQDELAASAYQAVEVDRQFNGEPVQVRVSMGKEPRHFLAIFKGKLVIFEVRRHQREQGEVEAGGRRRGAGFSSHRGSCGFNSWPRPRSGPLCARGCTNTELEAALTLKSTI